MQHRAASHRNTMCNNKNHGLVLGGSPAGYRKSSSPPERAGALGYTRHGFSRREPSTVSENDSGGTRNVTTGSRRNGFRIRIRTIARTHLALTSLPPGHPQMPPQRTHRREVAARRTRTPLVGALALHGVSGKLPESHLGSTLMPGRAVLTRGVFRCSGSVAYVRADASPNEVLACTSGHRNPGLVKPPRI
jgi:hypothetical protein